MDVATVAGLAISVVLVAAAIIVGGNPVIFIDIQSLLIVIGGGCIGAPMMAFPLATTKGLVGIAMKAFFVKTYDPVDTIKFIVELAQKARKESLLALENVEIENEFLKKGITLAVDGTEPPTIKAILTGEMTYIKKRHENAISVLKYIMDSAPAFGMIGTLVGLVNMLATLSDPSAIGPAMAVAILTTLYGALAANVICAPIARKLEWYDGEESMQMEIIIEGINSILEGDHPAIAEQKLMGFLPAAQRTQSGGE
ncbi:MotA/TolQ/ExbB proton channel family protein [Sulfidibacter corallicola]|uniref:MotA/TolQ/ExbB proton channel family protein n=1 Tax=Sulfidibacter corallicola TaxID=2818388 RepID=A0A8A4TV53_SULCO|nr:MotA/TolQ/ExbB proton channel family protein [Sulfidibacter corallicola]QTD53836.1 MotA/TolQ/ExbB proton channel family protein [Sulfidibacter corallicola]